MLPIDPARATDASEARESELNAVRMVDGLGGGRERGRDEWATQRRRRGQRVRDRTRGRRRFTRMAPRSVHVDTGPEIRALDATRRLERVRERDEAEVRQPSSARSSSPHGSRLACASRSYRSFTSERESEAGPDLERAGGGSGRRDGCWRWTIPSARSRVANEQQQQGLAGCSRGPLPAQ